MWFQATALERHDFLRRVQRSILSSLGGYSGWVTVMVRVRVIDMIKGRVGVMVSGMNGIGVDQLFWSGYVWVYGLCCSL